MSNQTETLKLYKADPVADANQTFNIDTMLNDNWDKIDNALKSKANTSDLTSHTENKTVHITANERSKWDAKPTTEQAQAIATAAETNATNASVPRTGGTMTGNLTVPTILFANGGSITSFKDWSTVVYAEHKTFDVYTADDNKPMLRYAGGDLLVYDANGDFIDSFKGLKHSVSNGKAQLAAVIGNTLSTASFPEFYQGIVNLKFDLINRIAGMGGTVAGLDVYTTPMFTIQQHVNTIATGKKIATASVTFNSTTINTTIIASIPPLGFIPTKAIIQGVHIKGTNGWTGSGTGSRSILTLSTYSYTRLASTNGDIDFTVQLLNGGTKIQITTTGLVWIDSTTLTVNFIE